MTLTLPLKRITCNKRCIAPESTSAERTFWRNSPKLLSSFSRKHTSTMTDTPLLGMSAVQDILWCDHNIRCVTKSIFYLLEILAERSWLPTYSTSNRFIYRLRTCYALIIGSTVICSCLPGPKIHY